MRSEQKKITKEFFGGIVEDYFNRYLTMSSAKECLDIILELLGRYHPLEGEILDLGCGPGFLADMLSGAGHNVVGVDVSPEMIKFAEENSKNLVYYYEDDVEDFDKVDPQFTGFFDVAIAKGLFEYLETDEKLLKNVHRMLKPGGHLIAEFRNAEFTYGDPDYVDPYPMKRRAHYPEALEQLSRELGFHPVARRFYHYHMNSRLREAASAFVLCFEKTS